MQSFCDIFSDTEEQQSISTHSKPAGETSAPRLRPLSSQSQEPTLEDALEEHHFTPPKPDTPTPAEADVRHS